MGMTKQQMMIGAGMLIGLLLILKAKPANAQAINNAIAPDFGVTDPTSTNW
jgi:hypothetical protein